MAFLSSSIKKVFLFALVMCCYNFATAQLKATTIGDASSLGDNCFQITPDSPVKSGGVWIDHPISFLEDFTIAYQNYFGANDGGGDGMVLVFKTTSIVEIGSGGEVLGYHNIKPSLIIEFDTHKNPIIGNPLYDHIALMSNGASYHLFTIITVVGGLLRER